VSARTTHSSQSSSRARRLRELLLSRQVTVLMEAHSGLSAKLAAEAGFEALWGSGLAISAALGVRDNNEASWTQVLEVLEFMADATELPILLDGDTGYGNFNNVRRLVRKLEQRNIAGVCLEDKLFPKTNSFIDGERQALAEVDEFCGKLHAAKDTQRDADFVVVARTEAFIAGWGLEETVLRATAYAEAGADLILVHSKRKDSKEIMAFMQRWDQRVPVIIVPTKYPSEPIDGFVRAGISNFIFANHAVRTVVTALQRNLGILRSTLDLMSIENEIAPVSEVFRLQNVQELKSSEERYLPSSGAQKDSCALVLAASKGDFGELVKDRPKAMLRLRGKPIMTWHTDAFRRQGIRRIGAVRGYCKQAIDLADIHYFDNDDYATTGELASLYAARDFLRGDVVIAYGDIVFDEFILRNLLSQGGEISIAVDGGWKLRGRTDTKRDLVVTSGAYDPMGLSTCQLVRMGAVEPEVATGEWIGLLHLRAEKTEKLVKLLDHFASEEPETLRSGDIPGLLNRLVAAGETVSVVHTFGHWYDLDEQKDLLLASAQVKS
jgi:phosphoenolpyruvate phosphomutase